MNKIKIGFSGAHGTGKTSFISILEKELKNKSITYKTVGGIASLCPLPILRSHTIESTLWIATKGILEEIEAENKCQVVLVDRSILDCWAYFKAAGQNDSINENKLKTLVDSIKNWLPTYDIIYQTIIDDTIPIENRKGRDLDINYRKTVGEEVINAFTLFGVTPKLLTSTNRETELEIVLRFITDKVLRHERFV